MRSVTAWMRLVLLLLAGWLAGCEDDGGAIGSGHDFGTKDPNVIVALGDSITAGSELPGYPAYPAILATKATRTVINAGASSQTSLEGTGRVESLIESYRAGYVFILYGANDIMRGIPREATIAALRSMVVAAKSRDTIPVLATLTPTTGPHSFMSSGINDLNFQIRQLASEQGVTLVDLAGAFGGGAGLILEDGLHPNEAGTDLIAASFARLF